MDRKYQVKRAVKFSLWCVFHFWPRQLWNYLVDNAPYINWNDLKKGKLLLWYRKRKLGKAYRVYCSSLRVHSCGEHLHNIISTGTIESRRKLDKAYEKCRKSDPYNIPDKSW